MLLALLGHWLWTVPSYMPWLLVVIVLKSWPAFRTAALIRILVSRSFLMLVRRTLVRRRLWRIRSQGLGLIRWLGNTVEAFADLTVRSSAHS